MPLTSNVATWEILELKRRLKKAEDGILSLIDGLANVTVPYDRVTGLTGTRLLGRYSTTSGNAQLVRLGVGLSIIGDIVSTGIVGTVASFTLTSFDDATNHEVTCVFDQGQYTLDVNQAPSGSSPVSGLTFTADDATNHVLRLRLDQGWYVLEVVQAPGGLGAIASLPVTCVTDSSLRTLSVVLDQVVYDWQIT